MERFLDYFTPDNYQLELHLDPDAETLEGTVTITGTPHADTIKLHAVDMTIDSVNADYEYKDGELIIFGAGGKANALSGARATNGERIERSAAHNDGPAQASPEGHSLARPCAIVITFHKSIPHAMEGVYMSTYQHSGHTEKIITTQFESHYARQCFPCIDEPAAKATFDVTITIPEGTADTVLFNTELKSQNQNTCRFQQTPKMSTYLLAFVVGNFHSKSITNRHGVTITSYCALNQDPANLDYANHIAAEALDYYDDQFRVPYPLSKLDQVALPDFEAGAMENWGLVTYRESCMLATDKSPIDVRKNVANVITHELSHQWFGNLVTMQWWDDLWLNESFANVIEYYATDHIHPEYHIWEDFFTGDCLAAFRRDALPGVQAVQQPVATPEEIATLFDGAIVYAKGAHLMYMLIRLMGEYQFFNGITDYFHKHQYSNTVGDDLWAALQSHADFNVKEFMHAWISQPGYPVITDNQQQRFLLTGDTDDTKWPLPEVTDDMSGHYLINLTDAEFAQALQDFDNLNLERKLRLLIDRMLLARTPLVPSASLLDLIPKFQNETSAPVWSIVASIIGELKIFCPPDTPEASDYHEYLKQIVLPLLTKLGLLPKNGEDSNITKLRDILTAIAYYTEDADTTQQLAALYQPDLTAIPTEPLEDILCAKLRTDESIFDDFLAKYQSTADPTIKSALLFALTEAREPANTTKLIKLLDQHDIVRPQDHLYLYIYLRRNPRTKSDAMEWLFDNWQSVAEMVGDKSIADYPRYLAGSIRTRDEADKFYAFFDPLAGNPALTRTLQVARTEIESRLRLIADDTDSIHAKLRSML